LIYHDYREVYLIILIYHDYREVYLVIVMWYNFLKVYFICWFWYKLFIKNFKSYKGTCYIVAIVIWRVIPTLWVYLRSRYKERAMSIVTIVFEDFVLGRKQQCGSRIMELQFAVFCSTFIWLSIGLCDFLCSWKWCKHL